MIVAVNNSEVPKLKDLYERGLKNNVRDIKLIGPNELREIEPHCVVSQQHAILNDWEFPVIAAIRGFKKKDGCIHVAVETLFWK